jgi:hypothetical protein
VLNVGLDKIRFSEAANSSPFQAVWLEDQAAFCVWRGWGYTWGSLNWSEEESNMALEITLPKGFTETDKATALDYLETIGPALDWPRLVRTFNRLREALVPIPGQGRRTFASVYTHLIDARLMGPFIEALSIER